MLIHMAFVDYEGAFDSVQCEGVFEGLECHGAEDKFINIRMETYDGGTSQVQTESLSRKIKIRQGVGQGDTLSRLIFIAALEEIFGWMEIEVGININSERLNKEGLADAVIPFAESKDQLSKLPGRPVCT